MIPGGMTPLADLCAELAIEESEVRVWIAQSWVRPEGDDAAPLFAEIDIARIRLICDLRHQMGLDPESLPVVLGLLDQLYAERARLRHLAAALADAPPELVALLRARLRGTAPAD